MLCNFVRKCANMCETNALSSLKPLREKITRGGGWGGGDSVVSSRRVYMFGEFEVEFSDKDEHREESLPHRTHGWQISGEVAQPGDLMKVCM